MLLVFLVDHDAVVEKVIGGNGTDECLPHMIRIALEVEFALPADLFTKELDTLITRHGIVSVFEDDQGNREELARSLIELKAWVARFVDKNEHCNAVYAASPHPQQI